MSQVKYTIKDLRSEFLDEEQCLEWLKNWLYPEGIYCPKDKRITPHHPMKTRKSYSCELCGHHMHPTAGTIFHKSSTPLTLWIYAIYLMASTKSGISAKQLERELGVTYKTAWRMFHQIRKLMTDNQTPLTGDVEIDETYLSPNPMKRKKNKSQPKPQIVFGMIERDGKVRAIHVPKAGVKLLPLINKNITSKAHIYSDSYPAYKALSKNYTHSIVKHMEKEYVNGNIHTQNIESFWANLKRGILGVYRHVDPKYLQAYVDEYAFRHSHRNSPNMFWALMNQIKN